MRMSTRKTGGPSLLEPAPDEAGAVVREADEPLEAAAQAAEDPVSGARLEDEEREEDLEARPPSDDAPADGLAVVRGRPADPQEDEEPEGAGELVHEDNSTQRH